MELQAEAFQEIFQGYLVICTYDHIVQRMFEMPDSKTARHEKCSYKHNLLSFGH